MHQLPFLQTDWDLGPGWLWNRLIRQNYAKEVSIHSLTDSGGVDRASETEMVDSGSNPSRVKSKTPIKQSTRCGGLASRTTCKHNLKQEALRWCG